MLNGYLTESVTGIRQLGVDVDVYIGNEFAARRGVKGFHPGLSPGRLAAYLREQHYDFAVSFNNALITPAVVDALDCHIVTVLVDSEQHLFDHAEMGGFSAFGLDVIVSPIYSSLCRELEERHPAALLRCHFLPPATHVKRRRAMPRVHPINVSWIASLVGDDDLDLFARHVFRSAPDSETTVRCLRQIRRTGYLDDLRSDSAVVDLSARVGWDVEALEIQLQNIATNSERVAAVERLTSRGLRLFGNARWSNLIPQSVEVTEALVAGEEIVTHAQQMDVYDNSLISINIPQINAKTGLQYRVLDIMASRALLITRHVPGSDLEVIFGKDHPVPTFRTHEELVRLVDHFLSNEAERQTLVRECNQLVASGFSFVDRALDHLTLSNPSAAQQFRDEVGQVDKPEGALRFVPHQLFVNWTGLRD